MFSEAQLACYITETEDFGDPYLRYYSYRLKGTALILLQHPEDALSSFIQAYHDLEWSNEHRLLVEVLFHGVTAALQSEQFDICQKMLDHIYALVENEPTYEKSCISQLYNFRAYVSDMSIN